ncbi:MAG: ABC transporter ATP-binding protein [Peptococcaceae bacterium]|nr:ABC transporter ATP-binding protein [Peptococcaceae bacterium]
MDYLNPLLNSIKMANSIVVFGAVLLFLVDIRIGIAIIALSFFSAILVPTLGAKIISHRHKVYLDTRGEYMAKMKDLLEGFKLIRPDTRNSIFREHEAVLSKTAQQRFQYEEITIGTAAATLGFIESFITPIQSIITDMATIRGTKDIKDKVLAMLDWSTEGDMPPATAFNEAIAFEGVTVRYKDFSLENFSFKFHKGKKYAIIGPNGSGKSTVVRALMKYVDLDAGKICVDGKERDSIDTTPIMWCVDQREHIFMSDFFQIQQYSALLRMKRHYQSS